jgi:hypothetical protein
MRVLDYEDEYEDYEYDDEYDDLDYEDEDDDDYDDLDEDDFDFDDDEDDDDDYDEDDYDEDDEDDEDYAPRRRSRKRSKSRRSVGRAARSAKARPAKARPPKRVPQPKPVVEEKVPTRAKRKPAKAKKASRVPVVILTLMLIGAFAYSAVVVMKNNELQSQGEVIQAENDLMAEKLETAGLSPNVLPFQEGAEEEIVPKPYVLTIWGVEPTIISTGSTMEVSVKANVLNDSPRVLDNDNVPQLICGGQSFPGTIEGDSIPAFHGEGTVIWRATGVPVDAADFTLEIDDQHLVYYLEKISDAVINKRHETLGF